jgi:IMP dehydrogenase
MESKALLEKSLNDGIALTFDDVRLRTGYSAIMPDDVSLATKFSKNVDLKIPIVSSPMDTVTGEKLAIELAKLGGIGIIHRNLSPEEQARQVSTVKRHLNGLIEKPICVYEDETIAEVLEMKRINGYTFHSFPVLNVEEKLVGIVTGNDFEFCDDNCKFVKNLMTQKPLIASESTSIEQAYEIMIVKKKKALPLVDFSGKISGMYVFTDVKRIMKDDAKTYNVDSRGQLRVGAAIGVKKDAFLRLNLLVQEKVDVVVIDTAHGDSINVLDTLREIKKTYPNLDVVVGNVSVGESVKRLVEAGADGIRVGQGPGSICTTRIIAGVGRPQLSAVYDCAKVADRYGIPICADGGLKTSGDIPIAIAAGAHCVMMGSMLAGTDETPGEMVFFKGRQWKSYRGMGSLSAMRENKGARERYLQDDSTGKDLLIPEGVDGLVPYKGRLYDVIFQYVGGLRHGMGYVGAVSIQNLREKGEFDRITDAGKIESHPHNINITNEAPNYSMKE